MSTPLADRIIQQHGSSAAALPLNVVSREGRRLALEALASRGLPTTRDENWKYTNLRPLERVSFAPVTTAPALTITPTDLPQPINGYARYTFVDGVFAPELSNATENAGVRVRALRSQSDPGSASNGAPTDSTVVPGTPDVSTSPTAATKGVFAPNDDLFLQDARLALLNEAFATDGALVQVAANTQCPGCLELVFIATADAQSAASYPRIELEVEPNAQLGIIERHISLGSDASFVNAAVKVSVGRGAKVDHYRLQQMGARAVWFDTLLANVEKDATYKVHVASIGALSARSTLQIRLAEPGAQVGLHAVSVADRNQVHDIYAVIDHAAPRTRTEQSFRGISGGRARVAFNGKVIVREGAQGADSQQSLRGLLAGPDAEIDVRPQLEIYTDDVRCAHGATAGKLDETMLFYLLSRGLDRETAQRLLKWAFLEDVVSKIGVPELRKQIELSLAGRMQETDTLKELL